MTTLYFYILATMIACVLLTIAILLFYLKYRKNLLQQQYQLRVAEVAHQKALLHAMITSQERERRRIGMDLHDEVGSVLSALRLMVDRYSSAAAIERDSPELFGKACKGTIDQVIANVRNIAHNLSPAVSGAYGFYEAMADFCDVINAGDRLHIVCSVAGPAATVTLPADTALALYRVFSELITNTLRHSEASAAALHIDIDAAAWTAQYEDNGHSFTPAAAGGMGMRNIESRLSLIGALYTITNSSSGGFRIEIVLPHIKQTVK